MIFVIFYLKKYSIPHYLLENWAFDYYIVWLNTGLSLIMSCKQVIWWLWRTSLSLKCEFIIVQGNTLESFVEAWTLNFMISNEWLNLVKVWLH